MDADRLSKPCIHIRRETLSSAMDIALASSVVSPENVSAADMAAQLSWLSWNSSLKGFHDIPNWKEGKQ